MNRSAIAKSAALLLIIACAKKDEPKVPLGAAKPPNSELIGEARTSLDSGNALFRLKAYDQALAQYERASISAPHETAPLLGILMVSEATGNAKLSESALARLRKLDPSLADSSAATPHSRMIRSHPKVPPASSG
jgi:hypothetical protein